ncbi:MAG: TldD/PmbA family protein [Candidatus Portnoybacteria bacterium]|nr:TldD/PmbA family protein [Candidatus Portnoybacteria bacterium]
MAPDNEERETPQKDDYAELTGKFQNFTAEATESSQERGPSEIKIVSAYIDARTGVICETDENGIPHIIAPGEDPPDSQGKKKRQRFFIGLQTEATTKDTAIKSVSLGKGRNPKVFTISKQTHDLLEPTIEAAQQAGHAIQKKIDEQNYEWFPIFLEPPKTNSVYEDRESKPNLELIKDLVAFGRETVIDNLGSRAQEVKAKLLKWTEHYIYGDNLGNQTDQVVPRVAFTIQVKTKDGNEAFGVIAGAMGTIQEVLTRYIPDDAPAEEKELKNVIKKLATRVSDEATDLDRAQGTGILGSECPVILAPQVAGVLAHEVIGHPSESDIICANRREKSAQAQLKPRLGAQVSIPQCNIIDTPDATRDFDGKIIKHNFGALPVDGHGTKGKTITIVKSGIMIGVLNDRKTLEEIVTGLKEDIARQIRETGLSGSVRREKYDNPPQVRMRNTFILPDPNGPTTKEEMAASIPKNKKGVYIKSCNGGWVNTTTGDFAINGRLCYLIENGQITDKPIKSVIIKGNIMKFAQLIKALGNAQTMHHTFTGYCGKNNQWVPVDGGGPLVYLESAQIGGGSGPFHAWSELVKEYCRQSREVKEGKRPEESVYFPEIAEVVGPEENHYNICLVSEILPDDELKAWIMGTKNYSSHEITNGEIVERNDRYE